MRNGLDRRIRAGDDADRGDRALASRVLARRAADAASCRAIDDHVTETRVGVLGPEAALTVYPGVARAARGWLPGSRNVIRTVGIALEHARG
jgi:hypothetical protein